MIYIKANELINRLNSGEKLNKEEYTFLFSNTNNLDLKYIYNLALEEKQKYYANEIFLRGIVEFTNYCKNDCLYCGIRQKNTNVKRYRLTKEEILSCCKNGYSLGIRTFVLQGGEDPFYSTEAMCDIVSTIKSLYSDCAVTLSIGEQSDEAYKQLKEAGADRFLLREETADIHHYSFLHPKNMSAKNRYRCLYTIKKVGFHTGGGFMVGSPGQTDEHLAQDMIFLRDLQPHMVGIGPFIPHKDSTFKDYNAGELDKTLLAVSLTRLTLKKAMIPSTTALETISKAGRIKGFLAGANVIMVNITPADAKGNYLLYNDKAFINKEASACIDDIKNELAKLNMVLSTSIGNPCS